MGCLEAALWAGQVPDGAPVEPFPLTSKGPRPLPGWGPSFVPFAFALVVQGFDGLLGGGLVGRAGAERRAGRAISTYI